jgi:hypothetical protein
MLRLSRRRGDDSRPDALRNGVPLSRALGVAAALATSLCCGSTTAGAVTVTVPDDWPTIQQAIDSGADEVLIRPGVYPETLVISRQMDVKGLVPYGTSRDSLPVISGLVFEDFRYIEFNTMYLRVWSLHILSQVRNQFETSPFWDPLEIELAGCALDGGLRDSEGAEGGQIEYYIRACWIDDVVQLSHPQRVHFERSRIRAPIVLGPWPSEWYSAFDFVIVRENIFSGPEAGIQVTGAADNFDLIRNRFEGCRDAVRGSRGPRLSAYENTFVGPGRVAIECTNGAEIYPFHRNSIAGYELGLVVRGELFSQANRIEDCGVAIDFDGWYGESERDTILSCDVGARFTVLNQLNIRGAIVLGCREDGLRLQAGIAEITSSVVGRSGGDGIRLSVNYPLYWTIAPITLTGNTSYANGGSGYALSVEGTSIPAVARNNIAYGNAGHGLDMAAGDSVIRACNDWFGNALGDVNGVIPSPDDLSVDPLFCDVAYDDVRLSAGSPCLSGPCGVIGRYGMGCEVQVTLRLLTFAAASSGSGVEVRWRAADQAPDFTAWVERADVAVGPWTAVATERSLEGEFTVDLDRDVRPEHSYWYRLIARDRGTTRVLGEPIEVVTAPAAVFALRRSGPNPANGPLEVEFQLAHAADIALELFDPQGRRVASLARGTWPDGVHGATWSGGRTAPPGVYLLRYRYPGGEVRRRIVLTR